MLIKTEGLRKEFGSTIAVKNTNLEIPKGVIYGLIGPNGAGKSTTFRMITGLLEPTDGHIVIEGIDVWKDPLNAFSKIGFLPDFFELYEKLKVWEYLDFFANAYKMEKQAIPDKIDEILKIVNLTDKKDEYVSGLSRGMKQRLGIAKTIIHDPELIILDEPASGLDPIARKELMQTILKLNSMDKTILISSHILSELSEVCNYVGIMNKGRLVKSGEISTILEEEKEIRKIEVTLLRDQQKLFDVLKKYKTVKNLELTSGGIIFDIVGDDKKVADLHKKLITDGHPIISFNLKKKDISDIFMEVSEESDKEDKNGIQ